MGSTLHRFTIVLVAGIVLLAAVLVIVVPLVAPQSRSSIDASPQPVAISSVTPTTDVMPATEQALVRTHTATVGATHTPSTVATPPATSSALHAPAQGERHPAPERPHTMVLLRDPRFWLVMVGAAVLVVMARVTAVLQYLPSRRRVHASLALHRDPASNPQPVPWDQALSQLGMTGASRLDPIDPGDRESEPVCSATAMAEVAPKPAAANDTHDEAGSWPAASASLTQEVAWSAGTDAHLLPTGLADVKNTVDEGDPSLGEASGDRTEPSEPLRVVASAGECFPEHVGIVDPSDTGDQDRATGLLALLAAADSLDDGLAALLPERAALPVTDAGPTLAEWTADDRAMIVCAAVLRALAQRDLRSPLIAIDVIETTVQVMLDIQPDAAADLQQICGDLAATFRDWRCSWQSVGLTIVLPLGGSVPGRPWPIVVPVLLRGRGKTQITRYIPLASWRHLGVYGHGALGVAHHIVTSVLCQQPPDALALAIIDGQRHPMTAIYRSAPHLVPAPSDPGMWVEHIVRAVRHAHSTPIRMALCVVVEPQDAWLDALQAVFLRLRSQSVPLHLLLVSSALSARGRDVYAALPALMTEGVGPAHWIHGTQRWPAGGHMQMVINRMTRCDGEPFSVNDNEAAALVQQLPALEVERMPVIWEVAAASPGVATAIAGGSPNVPAHTSTPVPPSVEDPGAIVDEPLLRADASTTPVVEPPVGSLLADVLDEGADQAETAPPLMLDRGDAVTAARSVIDAPVTCLAPPDAPAASPTSASPTEAASLPAESPRPLSAAAQRLAAIVSGAAPTAVAMGRAASVPDVPADDAEFPPMPGKLRGSDLRNILTRAICNETIVAGPFPGLSPKRLKQCMDRAFHPYADTVLVWFEQAGLLAEPVKAEEPFRHPRRLMNEDLRWMAERLRATPVPQEDEVVAAMNRGSGT